jgi:hypothetical protein
LTACEDSQQDARRSASRGKVLIAAAENVCGARHRVIAQIAAVIQ